MTWLIAAGALVLLGVQAGGTAAGDGPVSRPVAGKCGARAVVGAREEVRIHLRGALTGLQSNAFGRGRFTASGAFVDRGRFVDDFEGIHPPAEPHRRTLYGAKGRLEIDVDRSRRWRIIGGTGRYARLCGRGTEEGLYRFIGIDATMIGTVWR